MPLVIISDFNLQPILGNFYISVYTEYILSQLYSIALLVLYIIVLYCIMYQN